MKLVTIHSITGAGIYVQTASRYGGTNELQPNNTYIIPSSGFNYFALYCCSGSKNNYIGSITDLNGNSRTSSYDNIYEISQYSSGEIYAGCVRFAARKVCSSYDYWYGNCISYYSGPTTGVYTCNIQDEHGATQHVGFTILSSKCL